MRLLNILLVVATAGTMAWAAETAKVISQAADGTVTLPAKEATTHGKNIRYEPQPHKNTIGFWTKADDWVSWDFEIKTPGKFAVVLTQSCGKGSGGSEYTVTVGEQVIRDVVPDTGSFTNWVERTIGAFNFKSAGSYTVAVKPVKKPGLAVMDLRAITLKPEAKAK
jgi:hypothetical protein